MTSRQRSTLIAMTSLLGLPLALERVAAAGCGSTETVADGEVCLYTDANFGGAPASITVSPSTGRYGVYFPTMSAGHPIPNDSLSSFKVGANVTLTVCTDWDYDTTSGLHLNNYCYTYGPGSQMSSLPVNGTFNDCTPSVGLCNDWASSIKVVSTSLHCDQPPPADQCAFYTDWHYGNECSWLPVGDYKAAGSPGLHDNWISSMRCGANVKADLFADPGYGGTSWLGRTDGYEFTNGENDTISSIHVVPR